MLRDYLFLAIGSLRVRKLRTWLTMIGIFIGIATIVSLISLGQGMKDAISAQFQLLGSDRITIQAKGLRALGPPGSFVATPLTKSDLDAIEKINGVGRVAGRLIKPIEVIFLDKRHSVFAADIPTDEKERSLVIETIRVRTAEGRFLERSDKNKIVVGNDYSSKEILGRKVVVGDKMLINGKSFEVIGILEKKGLPMFDFAFIMNEQTLRDVTGIADEESIIVAEVAKGADIGSVAEAVKRGLRKHRLEKEGKESFDVSTPEQFLRTLTTILTIVQAVLIGIAVISLFVGGIGIMNTMYTAVLERTKEIGIMKAIGARNSDVLLIFVIESGMLGLAGGIIGIILGIGLAKAVEFIAVAVWGNLLLQANISTILVIGSLAFSFFVGAISGLIPSIQASRMVPVSALRSK